MPEIRLSYEPEASPEDVATIENAIYRFNMEVMQDHTYIPIHIFLRDQDNTLQGGITGGIWGGWMHINFLWVKAALRQQGYGAQLLAAAEAEAQNHDCLGIYLETFDFQARDFYLKYGYSSIGELKNYPPGHSQYLMQKVLQVRS